MSSQTEEVLKYEVDLMEKEIIYLKGKRRQEARKAYFKLLEACGESCGINTPVYLKRSY